MHTFEFVRPADSAAASSRRRQTARPRLGARFSPERRSQPAAVHHATGVRVRELPVKIENLLK